MQSSLEVKSAVVPFPPQHDEEDIVVFQEPRILAISAKPLALSLGSSSTSNGSAAAASSSSSSSSAAMTRATESPLQRPVGLKRKQVDNDTWTNPPPDKRLTTTILRSSTSASSPHSSSAPATPTMTSSTTNTSTSINALSSKAPPTNHSGTSLYRTHVHPNPNPNPNPNSHSNPNPNPNPNPNATSNSNPNPNATSMASGVDLDPTRKQRLVIKVLKKDKKLGFGINHDNQRRLRISSLQTDSAASGSDLQVGDVLLSVNGHDLTNLEFFEGVTKLKAMGLGELTFEIERTSRGHGHGHNNANGNGSTSSLRRASTSNRPAATMTTTTSTASTTTTGGRCDTHSKENSALANNHQTTTTTAAMSSSSLTGGKASTTNAMLMMATTPSGTINMNLLPAAAAAAFATIPLPKKLPITASDFQTEFRRLERAHKHALNALASELKNERAMCARLDEKNANLRRKVQQMLIECDQVRVQARDQLRAMQTKAQTQLTKLSTQLSAARAQLRLDTRAPNVSAQDSLATELQTCRQQLEQLQQQEDDQVTLWQTRFQWETRLAERDVPRVRDRLIKLWKAELKQVKLRQQQLGASSHGNGGGNGSSSTGNSIAGASGAGASSSSSSSSSLNRGSGRHPRGSTDRVMVLYEGVRRLTFMKLFELQCDLDFFCSTDFGSTQVVQFSLLDEGQLARVFGANALALEDRTGMYFFAKPPMTITYDPAQERVTLTCIYGEVNTIREMGRNIRL